MMQSDKKVDEILREAADAVAASDVPEDLRSVAFAKAVDLIAGTPTAINNFTEVDRHPNSVQPKVSYRGDQLEMISDKLDIELSIIQETFEAEDGIPQLIIARGKLANAKRAATKEIALLIAAARQAAEVEEWTESNTIRESVEMYGKYNKPNFASAISELEDDFSFSGKGQSRKVKVRREGFKNAGALVKRMHGKSET